MFGGHQPKFYAIAAVALAVAAPLRAGTGGVTVAVLDTLRVSRR